MIINEECIRDILLYCEKHITYKEHKDHTISVIGVSLDNLYDSILGSKYEKFDIMYSIIKLEESNFIILSNKWPEHKSYIERCCIDEITIIGHNFINAIKDDTIWNKTKNVAAKIGNHTLGFMEGVAHDVAVESAKQIINITMGSFSSPIPTTHKV